MQSSSNEQDNTISVALKEDEQQLGKVTITAVERKNTEVVMIQLAKNSSVIVSNISAQKIQRTQDSNAKKVIRHVPEKYNG